jgi:hypothetical protein
MPSPRELPVTASQLLFPLSLVAFVVFVLLAFQTSVIMNDRHEMLDAKSKQEKPLEQVQKVQAQLDALALGTVKLSKNGNKTAEAVMKHMEQLGISFTPPNATQAPAKSAP